MHSQKLNSLSRRQFLLTSATVTSTIIGTDFIHKFALAQAPAIITSEKHRPQIPYGVMSGDVNSNSAVIWSRTDKPAKMIVEYSLDESFRKFKRFFGSNALTNTDFTARANLKNLPQGRQIFYRVIFEDINNSNIQSVPYLGKFKTIGNNKKDPRKDIYFAWSGDTAGQGWGINPEFGGMKIYETIRQLKPDFFIHSGDYIYADVPISSEVKLDNGTIWKNITTVEKSKVAESITEFRGNYIYNLLDENVRRFNAEIPQLVQWDDHEVRNNWYPTQIILDDDRYQVKDISLLAKRAKQAFLEYTPIQVNPQAPQRIYRSFDYGNNLEVLMLDQRSYRGANSANRQNTASPETAFMGNSQIKWLKNKLLTSTATWKVIASDMPLGLIVADGKDKFENSANGDGIPLGRELEIADLLRFIKQKNIKNIVWLTADVHYAAAHYYDPNQAQFQDFKPFWEFVAGPLNSGTFGPSKLDNTFGIQVKFNSVPADMKQNQPPSAGLQFFGTVKIDANTKVMTVTLHNLVGEKLYSVNLPPEI